MKTFTIFNDKTGQAAGLFTTSKDGDPFLVGKLYLPGEYLNHYIKDGQPVKMVEKPGEFYTFDANTKEWVFDNKALVADIKKQRARNMATIDRINPLWWNSMTQSQQDEVAQYRQALLDITAQPGYPTQIEWPQKPSWL